MIHIMSNHFGVDGDGGSTGGDDDLMEKSERLSTTPSPLFHPTQTQSTTLS